MSAETICSHNANFNLVHIKQIKTKKRLQIMENTILLSLSVKYYSSYTKKFEKPKLKHKFCSVSLVKKYAQFTQLFDNPAAINNDIEII